MAAFSRTIILPTILLLIAGCRDTPVSEFRSDSDVMQHPLSSLVTAQTLVNIASLAAKDRLCRASILKGRAQSESSNIVWYDSQPSPGTYGDCIYQNQATPCEVTVADLRTLRTLYERDPRLKGVTDFENVISQIDLMCGARNVAISKKNSKAWASSRLLACGNDQPILINQAIRLRWPAGAVSKDSYLWQGMNACISTPAMIFIDYHCDAIASRTTVRAKKLRYSELSYAEELGIEPYFCS